MMAGLVLVGVVAYFQLPVSALPQVDYPIIQIQTFYPGASPEVMTSSITAPLEKQFGQVPGLNQMTSISSFGSSLITLQFALELNIDIAEQEVQAAINAAGSFLPKNLPIPPVYAKTNPADAPILTIAITSNTLPLSMVEDLAETRMAQRISQLQGRRSGEYQRRPARAVRMQANPIALAAYGLSLERCARPSAAPTPTPLKATSTGPSRPGPSTITIRSNGGPICAHHHRLSQRRAGAHLRRCQDNRRHREYQTEGLG